MQFEVNTAHLKKISLANVEQIKTKKESLEEEIKQRKFIQAWKSYEKIKSLKNGLDYADLNHKALELLNKFPEAAEDCKYLIIDEFQDTNKLQCELIKKIAPHKNITIVGDLNQSIYRFRGAYKDNLNYIKKELNITEADLFKLDKSYRSTNKILSVAHKLIRNNYQNPEECFEVKSANNEHGEPVTVCELKNAKEEVRKTIEIIRYELEKRTPFHEICVIFRTHQQANLLKKELGCQKIPFITITKEPLLKQPVIKKIRAYLNLINKYQNNLKGGDSSWWDLLHESFLEKKDEIACAKALQKLHNHECIAKEIIDNGLSEISEQAKTKLSAIIKIIKSLSESKSPGHEIIKKLYQIIGIQSAKTKEEQEKILSLERFHTLAKEFGETESPELFMFLHHLEMLDALNVSIDTPTIAKEGIRIMTNHATKGLEYTAVIINCLAQKKFPLEHRNKKII